MDLEYTYPRETVEYVYFKEILVNNQVPNVADVSYSLTTGLVRPTVWAPVVEVNAQFAFQLDGTLPAGDYRVFIKVQNVVIEAGRITLT